MVFMATPAFAHHKADHEQGHGNSNEAGAVSDHDGDADSSSSTAYTEDNDTNDGGTPNNVSDDGDNRHPSGKDRSVENGGSGNQGKSESNPDDSKGPMRYEGALGDDKPNGPGGTDLADQDGNNGCGNDDDFDDDNNGWCGKPKKVALAPVAPAPVVVPELIENPAEPKDEVEGKVIRKVAPIVQAARPAAPAAPAAAQGAVLPFTGGAIISYLFAALGLVAAGIVTLRAAK
jgi:hypothetical protein